ncbi:MAG: uroporphyrinogen-III C-methyltransferase [Woeseiaceae bacterium]|nr:uroporphyrinogen-III C-methyltransferase [Woeseiaceae bacterium]
MSDNQNEIQAGNDAEFAAEDRTPAKTAARGNGTAWLAILLSVVALATAAYIAFEDWRSDDDSGELDNLASIESLTRRVDQSGTALAALESRVGQIKHPDYGEDIAAVRRDVEDQIRLLGSLPPRVSAVESSVASLAGISTGARETFLLAEAEYYLQIGNAQLQLANNPHLAALALGMADERVTQLSDPALTAVRRAIADELAALAVMKKPDLEGATLTLASLARVVESLPLAGETPAADDAVDAERSGVDRAWSSIKDAMSGLVKVTPPDQAKLALVSPDAEYFLRNNIALQLQSARLALLRGEQAIFEQTLDDTSALLSTYFDASSEQVVSALLTIGEIRKNVLTAAAPDISESLRLLRQVRILRESAE